MRSKEKALNAYLKVKFLMEYTDDLTAEAIRDFSTSNCDRTTARMYISYLTDFIVENGVPTKHILIN